MTTLIVYATNSSGTMLAAELASRVLQAANHTVTLKRANAVDPGDFKLYDLVVLGSCTWGLVINGQWMQGQLQNHMYDLQQKLVTEQHIFPGKKFAVFALGDSSYTHFCAAADHLQGLVNDLGGELIAEPLRIDGWFFRPKQNEKLLTDWAGSVAAAM